jgi:hypothetical protein
MNQDDIKRFKGVAAMIQGKEEKGPNQYMALCPVHGDANQSLFMELKDDGKIVLFCHAGCSVHQICSHIGISIQKLFRTPVPIAFFDFINLEGELIAQEVKYEKTAPKPFIARRPNKKAKKDAEEHEKWIWNVDNIVVPLYNLHDIVESGEDEIIFMCEGAKDARTIKYKGLIATAALLNDWGRTDTRPLNGRLIVILQDNDDAGKIKAFKAAHHQYGSSKQIKILLLPNLKKSGDVTDWFDAGGTKEKLLQLAMSQDLPEWFPFISIREQVENKEHTGLCFKHEQHIKIWETWEETFHPLTEGPLIYWDELWWKCNMKTKLYEEFSLNEILDSQVKFLALTFDASKKGDQIFEPSHELATKVTKIGMLRNERNVLRNPNLPIFKH